METTTVLKTEELKALFEAQLNSKRAFIVAVTNTANENFKQIEIAQSCKIRETDGTILAVLLNWSDGQILRTWQNVETSVLARMAPQVGEFVDVAFSRIGLDGPFNLQLEEYTQETNSVEYYQNVITPLQRGKAGAKAKINPTTNVTVKNNGYPVYRKVSVEAGTPNHRTLVSDVVGANIEGNAPAVEAPNVISSILSGGRPVEA